MNRCLRPAHQQAVTRWNVSSQFGRVRLCKTQPSRRNSRSTIVGRNRKYTVTTLAFVGHIYRIVADNTRRWAETTGGWACVGDDAAGFCWTENQYDWNGRTTQVKNADGTEIHHATTTVSIDGLTRSVGTDMDSDLMADRINTYALLNNCGGIGEAANDNQQQFERQLAS